MQRDIVSGALLMALAAGYYWATLQIPNSSLSDDVGAQGIPSLLAAALGIVATFILIRGVLAAVRGAPVLAGASAEGASAEEAGDEDGHYEASLPRALGLAALGALYIALAMVAGYIPALAVMVLAVSLYEGLPFGWQPVAVATGGWVVFWLLFVKLLGTEQPQGLLWGGLLRGLI
jgi:putative tricarboxylic transport membrane protein